MSPHHFASHLVSAVIIVLEFLASPMGGREIGRDLLERLGLRGNARKRK
ncbi:hypothetical protein [Roseibium sp. MMSF_3544]|nr:hypothetical protein [Roseibium sp. MMSF_3544]